MAFGTCPEAAAEVTREVRKVTKKAGHHKAVSKCYGHSFHSKGLRGGGGRRRKPYKHSAGNEDRP